MKVILGRYAATTWQPTNQKDKIIFGSDAFWLPEYNICGVAFSYHHYHLYPISERDVQAAFESIRTTLSKSDSLEQTNLELLQNLLKTIHHSFTKIDIATHIDGIEFEDTGIPNLPKPVDDPESEPLIHIVLLCLEEQHLSIASVGGFEVYAVQPTSQKVIFGRDIDRGKDVGGAPDFPGPFIAKNLAMPEIYSTEVKVQPNDLILVTTPLLSPLIAAKIKLEAYVNKEDCNLESIDQQLMTMLESTSMTSIIKTWGAAWAITCIEK